MSIRAIFKHATETMDCPSCEAEAGQPCTDRRGDELGTAHFKRLRDYRDDYIGGRETLIQRQRDCGAKERA